MNLGEVFEAFGNAARFIHCGYTVLHAKAVEDAVDDMSVVWHKPLH